MNNLDVKEAILLAAEMAFHASGVHMLQSEHNPYDGEDNYARLGRKLGLVYMYAHRINELGANARDVRMMILDAYR